MEPDRDRQRMSELTAREILDAFDHALAEAARRVAASGRWSTPHLRSSVVDIAEPASHFENDIEARK